jgi:hypothetical protein
MPRTVVLLAGLVACTGELPDAPEVTYRSTLTASTRGLVLAPDGETGHAGMFGTNCPYETETGGVTGDYDLPDEGEEVTDGGETDLGPQTVVLTLRDRVHLLEKSTGEYLHEDLGWPGADEVRLTDRGFVGLTSADLEHGCAVAWRDADATGFGASAPAGCDAALDAAGDGTVVLTDRDGPRLLDPDGSTVPIDGAADLVVFDDTTGLAYLAEDGGREVRAVDRAGVPAWTTRLDGAVVALTTGGAAGEARASIALDGGGGALVVLDGATGAVLTEVPTPKAAPGLSSSADGRTLAVVLEAETYFYRVAPAR